MHLSRLLLANAAALAATPALAGGFYLQEQSPLAVGRAFAGEAAIGDSAATIWFNPAGMTRLPGTSLELGAHILDVSDHQTDLGSTRSGPGGTGSFPTGGGGGGNPFKNPIIIPSGYVSAQVGQSDLWLGLGISAPFGVKVVYDNDFFGRYDSLRSDLKSFNIQPSVAYKLGDHFSVGGGVDIQTLRTTLTSALPNLSPLLPDGNIRIRGSDIAFGWNVGVLADFGAVRLGASYRSHVSHKLDGAVTIGGLLGPLAGSNGTRVGRAPISTPDIAIGSVVFGQDQLRLLGSVSWYNWSRFKRITVEDYAGNVFLDSEQRYRDTWSGSAGVEYDISPKLTVRAGGMYDQTPTRDAYRTTRVPDGDRTWATAGLTYHVSKNLALNASYAHVFVKSENVNRSDPLFAGTPVSINVATNSRNSGNADEIASSISLRF